MSIFNWLFSRSKPAQSSAVPSAGLNKLQAPQVPAATPGQALAMLKQQRQDRRDQLYNVVRDVMLRSEVLASHYKFKVLSLDALGRQFLIMIDLVGDKSLSAEQLTHIEHLMGSTAAQHHDLVVKAVYWRQTEQLAQPVTVIRPVVSAPPAPTPAVVVAAAPITHDVAPPTPRGRGGAKKPGFDPIGQDEVLAFKRAIASQAAASAPAEAAVGEAQVSGLRNSAAMTGFEDTQLLEPDDTASPLSSTQFGQL